MANLTNSHGAFVSAKVCYNTDDAPGVVEGLFCLDLKRETQIRSIDATLRGRITCCNEASDLETGCYCDIRILDFLKLIRIIRMTDGHACKPGKHSWPFTFQLPLTAAISDEAWSRLRERNYLSAPGRTGSLTGIPLPPSCERKVVRKETSCSHNGVRYWIEIIAHTSRAKFFGSKVVKCAVYFDVTTSTPRFLSEPTLQNANVFISKGHGLVPHISFDAHIRSNTKKRINFEVYVRFPATIQLENLRPFPFVIVVRAPKEEAFVRPPMWIENVQLFLRTRTEWCNDEHVGTYSILPPGLNVTPSLVFEATESSDFLRATVDFGQRVGLHLPTDQGDGTSRPSPTECQPQFTTWALKVWHDLSFGFDIAWEGGSYHVSSENGWPETKPLPILVLPAYRGHLPPLERRNSEGDLPPSYALAVADPAPRS